MQEELNKFVLELELKNKEADSTMQQMVVSQAEAEEKKKATEKLSAELEVQNQEVTESRATRCRDLRFCAIILPPLCRLSWLFVG